MVDTEEEYNAAVKKFNKAVARCMKSVEDMVDTLRDRY